MTEDRALELALAALHEKRIVGLPLPASMNEWAQAINIIEALRTERRT